VRTAADLIDICYTTVGRNCNLFLNLSPDTRGLIPDNQLAHLRLATRVVDETFARNLAKNGKHTADTSRVGLFKQESLFRLLSSLSETPTVWRRSRGTEGIPVVCALDGSAPTAESAVYCVPASLVRGCRVRQNQTDKTTGRAKRRERVTPIRR